MKFSIAIGKVVAKSGKVSFRVLGSGEDADKQRELVDKAGASGAIVEGYVLKNPDRGQFSYRRNFEAPPPPLVVEAPPTPLTPEQIAQAKIVQALGVELPAEPTAQDIASAIAMLQDALVAHAAAVEPAAEPPAPPPAVHPSETLGLDG